MAEERTGRYRTFPKDPGRDRLWSYRRSCRKTRDGFRYEGGAYDPIRPAGGNQGASGHPVDLDTLFCRADVITLHIPHSTHPLHPQRRGLRQDETRCTDHLCRPRRRDRSQPLCWIAPSKVVKLLVPLLMFTRLNLRRIPSLARTPLVVDTLTHVSPSRPKKPNFGTGHDILSEVIAGLDEEPLRWRVA